MSAEIIPITHRLERLWGDYTQAALIAQSSTRLEDGIAAGRAWRRWLDAFMSSEQRQMMGGPQ